MTRIELPFPVPLHGCFTNVKGVGRVSTARYKAFQREAWAMIAQQKPTKFKGPVSVAIRLVAPDKRKRDGDNLLKAIFDTLKTNGVIEDDNGSIVRRFTVDWWHEGTPCVVIVQAAEEQVAA